MNILIIIPPADSYLTPLLGVGILSSIAKKAGHNVNVIDLNIMLYNDIEVDNLLWRRDFNDCWDSEDICDLIWRSKLKYILEDNCNLNEVDSVFIRVAANSKLIANKIAKWVRESYPRIKLTAGGPQTWYKEYNDYEYFDRVIKGYAEKEFAGMVGLSDYIETLPDFTWSSDHKYINDKMLPMETSRGCIYNCSFCQEKKFGRFEISSYDFLKKNLSLIKKLNYKEVYFSDSLLNCTPERLDNVLDLTKESGLKCKCNLVPFTLTKKNIEKLKKVSKGCFVGIETFSDRFAKKMRKPGKRNEIFEVLNVMRKVGLKIQTGMIIGGQPFQTENEFLSDIKDLSSYNDVIDKVIVSPLRVFNDSALFDKRMDYSEIGWEFNSGDFDNRMDCIIFMTKELEKSGINTEVSVEGVEDWINGIREENKRFRRRKKYIQCESINRII
jgi:radical SAM superfamily enzyme YgiQ (UPF0313 family)